MGKKKKGEKIDFYTFIYISDYIVQIKFSFLLY